MSHQFYSHRKLNDNKGVRILSMGSAFASDGRDTVRTMVSSQTIDHFRKRNTQFKRQVAAQAKMYNDLEQP
jgi:hypothetical protein